MRHLTTSAFIRIALSLCAAAPLLTGLAHAQSVKISPGYTTIAINQTLQYTAATTGLNDATIAWKVAGITGGNSTVGTITQTGLYTAPTSPTGPTITALASDGKTMDIVYVNVAMPGPTITAVSPNPVATGNATFTLTGTAFAANGRALVNGAATGYMLIDSTHIKISAWVGTAGNIPVQVQNPNTTFGPVFFVPFIVSGPPPATTISPTTASVNLGATQQFTSNNATSWTATSGTITAAGLYTAPATMPASSKVTVTATGPGNSASATVTLVNPNAQQIAPTAVTLNLGATQQFTSAGATSWTAVLGTVDPTGLYTAPGTYTASTDTVSATGPNGTAQATVTILPPPPTITSVSNSGQLSLGLFSASVTGTGFIASSIAKLNGSNLSTTFSNGALTISGFAAQSGPANLTVSNGASTSAPYVVQVGIANPKSSSSAARRFLERAAFGPTPADAAHVQTVGEPAWITEQFNMPQISNYSGITGSQGGMPAHFLTMAVNNADQLRQRVAFSLSQIFVTSMQKLIWNTNMVTYQDMLLADAFTNYRQIMSDVTLHPAMGQYLDMANNAKAAGSGVANENYARELMQLFTIGTKMLNQDGSLQLDASNNPVPTYSQFTVTEFARVFTGWTYAPAPGNPVQWGAYITAYVPMASYAPQHDTGSKQLLSASPVGAVAPAGLSPQQDLDNALDNIFNHPNMGPFVGKLLIQHLVKSNPSPAYVSRVAAAFNGGSGVPRGDMKNIITAILLDPEATANDEGGADQPADGHLQEPALFIPAFVRAFGGVMNDQNYFTFDLQQLGQDLFNAPSVFNYYSPGYTPAGFNLRGPEFQMDTPNNAIYRASLIFSLFNQYSNPVQSNGPGTTIDLTPLLPLASNPTTLVNALDLTLTHGTMPATMKTAIINAVTADVSAGSLHQVQTACDLILTSSYYNVWH